MTSITDEFMMQMMTVTKKIIEKDPGVIAGVFVYTLHPCRSFPGDNLPK